MPGKRRDFAGQFAVETVDFWLTDPRIRGTSATVKIFLKYTNLLAVKERRETLPSWYTARIIGDFADLDPKSSEKCLAILKEKSLLGQIADGRIIVYGVKSRHPNLTWKEGDISTDIQVHTVAQTQTQTQTQTEGPTRQKRASSASSVAFPEIYEILQSIDAKGYRTLKPYDGLERDLADQVRRLSRDRVVSEVKALRTWLEAKFAAGLLQREARHMPQQRLSRWLKKCQPGDDGNGRSYDTRKGDTPVDAERQRILTERFGG